MTRAAGPAAVVAGALLALQAAPSAQWPSYPDRNLPRLPDGTVDLEAPAPRTADGHADLSGVWKNVGWSWARKPAGPFPPGEIPDGDFRDLAAGFQDGLPLRPWAQALKDARMASNSIENPDAWCLPLGNMQFNLHPFPRKIVQSPGLIVVLYETHMGMRQIFTDGRPLPDNDPQPWWYGYSVGRWEGDTLVVETTNFRGDEWLDVNGSPLTEQARTIERFRRVNTGTLEVEVTVDDPKAYTRPFTVRLRWGLMPDDELIEMVCLENNRAIEHLDPN